MQTTLLFCRICKFWHKSKNPKIQKFKTMEPGGPPFLDFLVFSRFFWFFFWKNPKKTMVFFGFFQKKPKKPRENRKIQKRRPPGSMVLNFWIFGFLVFFFYSKFCKKCFSCIKNVYCYTLFLLMWLPCAHTEKSTQTHPPFVFFSIQPIRYAGRGVNM